MGIKMKANKSLQITIVLGLLTSLQATAAQMAVLALDPQKQNNLAYVVGSSRTLTDEEFNSLKSALKSQNLTLIDNSKNPHLEKFKIEVRNSRVSNDSFDLVDYIKNVTGIEAQVSIVDIKSMKYSTQENISSY